MYQTTIHGDRLYHIQSKGYGQPVELFGATDNGETPMSLLNIALASCVTMCVQGYLKQKHQLYQTPVRVIACYEEEQFSLVIALNEVYLPEKEAISAYVEEHCRVKKLLRSDLIFEIFFTDINESL